MSDLSISPPVQGAWIAYTPTVDQAGTVAATVTESAYCLNGKICTFRYYLSITGTGTTNNNITITLPLTSKTSNGFGGFIGWYDQSGFQTYAGGHTLASTTTISGILGGATSPGSYFGKAPNLPLGNGDVIAGTFIYEIA